MYRFLYATGAAFINFAFFSSALSENRKINEAYKASTQEKIDRYKKIENEHPFYKYSNAVLQKYQYGIYLTQLEQEEKRRNSEIKISTLRK